ncbi:uncharacterized protein LOC115265221 [Aedes albopictus]|uniref:Uncharacterized protein n=1 Tax=Aedes albopictus TaxID=7160 RepID=A0ABM1Y798_AEDAL
MPKKSNVTNTGGIDNPCKKCNRKEGDNNWVCCDVCESWEHFRCAGVSESIADKSWKCSDCIADWDGTDIASKSGVSFNESSVSKSSSRASQRLQLSLQHLEEQRRLSKLRAAEELKMKEEEARLKKLQAEEELKLKQVEEAAKLKQLDEEEEYLKQRYNLLMQIEDEKDPSSRRSGVSLKSKRSAARSGVSVKSKRDQLEKWLKGATVDEAGQSKPSSSGHRAALPVHTVSESNQPSVVITELPAPAAALQMPEPSNENQLNQHASATMGHVTALAKSYEQLLSGQEESVMRSLPIIPSVSASIPAGTTLSTVPQVLLSGMQNIRVGNPDPVAVCLSSNTLPAQNTLVSAAPGIASQVSIGPSGLLSSVYGSHPYYTAPQTIHLAPTNTTGQGLPSSSAVFHGNGPFVNPSISVGGNTLGPSVPVTGSFGAGSSGVRMGSIMGPTSAQLAARQVMPRELPKFNGDPQEWPIFYSSFKNTTEVCGYTDAENLARLQRCLGGSALEAVRSRLLLPASVPYVMDTLHKLYGRPEILISSLLKKVRNVPPPKSENLSTIVAYGLAIQNLVDHIVLADQQAHLSNPMLLQELVDKLPTSLKMQWGTYKQAFGNVNLATFNGFMAGLVNLASELTIDVDSAQNHHKQVRAEKPKQREKLFTHANESPDATKRGKDTSVEESTSKACSYCGNEGHQILSCSRFKSLDIGARWKAMRQMNLCRLCLVPHRKWPCRSKKECGVDGCRIRHHMLLHSNQSYRSEPVPPTKPSETVHHNYHHTKSYSLFRYLPVTLYGNGKEVDTYVFLDDGSSSTLLEEAIAVQLGIDGESDNLWLGWTGKIGRHEKSSKRVSVKISGSGKKETFHLNNVRTVRELGLPSQTLNYPELSKAYAHLQGLPVNSYKDAKPGMIIGIEHVHLLTSLKIREGCKSDPVATKTRLGWCIFGRNSGSVGSVEQLNLHVCKEMSNSDLYDSMKQFFAVEEAVVTKPLESEEDQRANNILAATTVRRGCRIESGLLWRKDDIYFPESYKMAMSRLRGLEKRLSRDAELRRRVNEQIASYEEKQYISKGSLEEVASLNPHRVWYLPLGVVINPKKPNKIRMVWDAAAKVGGVCFNDMLLKGPDLLVSLMEVLLRFRQGKVAVCSDIREMFLRILIREEDKWSQCFLWRSRPEEDVEVYVINVAMFGATSSPCTAQYVKNWNASEYSEQYPRAVEAVIKNHYVDDFLDSVDSVEEAVELVQQVKDIHAAAGFQFGKILSNEQEVLDRLGETSSAISKPLPVDKDRAYERVLGITWIPSEDIFTFSYEGLEEVLGTDWTVPTKRQVLRIVMKLYDPLGFVAHFVVQGKILMQEIWRTGTNWDEPIAEQLHDLWSRWIELYRKINDVSVPRCFFKELCPKQVRDIQIHVFTDASVSACACVAYLRMTVGEESLCSLIAAKTKVAPLRTLSIPRLELQAAMMGSRLLQNICSALTISIQSRFLWTDSATVLAWLRSDSRRYHQFVSFRVGEILSLTSVNEWRYVPSRENVADDATKWNAGPSFDPECRWYQGPAFLQDPESQWPTERSDGTVEAEAACEEIRVVALHRTVEEVVDVQRFSNWNRLLRAMAYVHRSVAVWKHEASEERPLRVPSQTEFKKAEETLWRQAQSQAYADEVRLLNGGHSVAKGSSIRALCPFMDERGVLRVGGRIEHAPTLSYEAKHPVVLPRNHRITYLLMLGYHQRFLHANSETVCNELRQQFYIPRMRSAVRSVCRSCQYCKIKKATPAPPMMGPLPKVRLTPFVRPFTYTGVDYMGPFEVKVGRSLVKRWICLFTCLTVRAVHLELAHSLSTKSCVMAFRRFVNRRGAPLEVFSDNGTNFVGASRQLSEEMQKINEINEDCASTFTNARTQWHFNVPAAPHMGGPWERMVKSVKVAMSAISNSPHHPSDEVMETVMLEAEGIVNSRPLTYVPLEAIDREALTPNHFLLYSSSGNKQSVVTADQSVTLRDSWTIARNIMDEFWRRWVREYLPMLTRRTKWFDNVKPLEHGDLVVIIDENARNCWERGRILEVFPDKSGQVRRATVQTARGVFARPAVKLAVLDVVGNHREPEEVATETEVVHGAGDVTGNTVDRETVVNPPSVPSQLSDCNRVG